MSETCEARVTRGGYFSRHSEMCGRPAKGYCAMSIPFERWEDEGPLSRRRPACGVHLRAKYVRGFEPALP